MGSPLSGTETGRPRGRAAVMDAVSRAAAELLAERSPDSFSVRDVADRAGVNHALVHRYFGGKSDLLRTVLAGQSEAIAARVGALGSLGSVEPAAVLDLLAEYPAYWRMLARAVLDSPDLLETGFPAANAFLDLIWGNGPGTDDRVDAVVGGSLALGWLVFGGHVARSVGLDDPSTATPALADTLTHAITRRH